MPEHKPHILILIDWYLPGYRAGGPIQSTSNLVTALGDAFRFSVITLDTDHASDAPYPDVESDAWNTRPEGTAVYYFSRSNLTYARLLALIRAAQPDFVYLNSMYSLPFTIWPWLMARRRQLPGRLVLAPRGMLQAGAVQLKWLKKRIFLALMRLSGVQRRIVWQATDAQEAADIARFFGTGLDIRLSPNIPRQQQAPWTPAAKQPGAARFVFTSRVSRKKNVEYFLRLLHRVRGEVVFDIYGPQEDPAYLALLRQEIAALPPQATARLMGDVPAPELPDVLVQYHFAVLTTHGENFGHAIFEGLLAGRPVLISDRTPWRGLADRQLGWDLPLEDNDAFVAAVQTATDMDQATWEQWSRAAWAYAGSYRIAPELREAAMRLFS
ncbi:MAG: hypothetical protein OHK0039_47200 [Bacteroidia bacterium]